MHKIHLINSIFTTIDKEDIEITKGYKWLYSSQGYVVATGNIYMHRLLLNAPKGVLVDHINGNPLDNRRSNLRLVTAAQNSMNKKLRKDSSSGYVGVSWRKQTNRWIAYIHQAGKLIYLGAYITKEEAIEKRTQAELKLYGNFSAKVSR